MGVTLVVKQERCGQTDAEITHCEGVHWCRAGGQQGKYKQDLRGRVRGGARIRAGTLISARQSQLQGPLPRIPSHLLTQPPLPRHGPSWRLPQLPFNVCSLHFLLEQTLRLSTAGIWDWAVCCAGVSRHPARRGVSSSFSGLCSRGVRASPEPRVVLTSEMPSDVAGSPRGMLGGPHHAESLCRGDGARRTEDSFGRAEVRRRCSWLS